jgi:brefeldin A-inhibited guanine nucleotide-exchange protein
MVEWSKDLYINPHLQSNLGLLLISSFFLSSYSYKIFLGSDSKPLNQNGYDQDSSRSSSSYVGNGIRRADSNGSINSSHSNSGLSSESSKNVKDFEIVRQRKELFEKGIDLFNQNPKKGLAYLCEKDLIHNKPEDIAQFFHLYQDVLDKTLIGDCLGHEDNHYKQIMYAYVDQLDFVKMDFLAALRKFLSGFRLPGEAQKIDRLMEKFAARYCECNSK